MKTVLVFVLLSASLYPMPIPSRGGDFERMPLHSGGYRHSSQTREEEEQAIAVGIGGFFLGIGLSLSSNDMVRATGFISLFISLAIVVTLADAGPGLQILSLFCY